MAKQRDDIRDFLIQAIAQQSHDVAQLASKQFGISRQGINRYLNKMIQDGLITERGSTRNREYFVKALRDKQITLSLDDIVEEDAVWREHIRPILEDVQRNIIQICEYGFTEMLNNAIDHSDGKYVHIQVEYSAVAINMMIGDDGVGIFNKIKKVFDLENEYQAILELAKGKLTTYPSRHSGEGIFFTSRIFDHFTILSGNLSFTHNSQDQDILFDHDEDIKGTTVKMSINTQSKRTLKEIFDQFSDEEYGFDKTRVPVRLAKFGDDNLLSRSQARRLLVRFDRFKEVILDFNGVDTIGQAFADEIFRVFQQHNPHVHIAYSNANTDVERMIKHVLSRVNDLNQAQAELQNQGL